MKTYKEAVDILTEMRFNDGIYSASWVGAVLLARLYDKNDGETIEECRVAYNLAKEEKDAERRARIKKQFQGENEERRQVNLARKAQEAELDEYRNADQGLYGPDYQGQ